MADIKNLADLMDANGQTLDYDPARRFLELHTIERHPDRNGNGDDVFNGANMTPSNRFPHHGYEKGQDEAVYKQNNQDVLDQLRQTQLAIVQRWMQNNQTNGVGERLAPVMGQVSTRLGGS